MIFLILLALIAIARDETYAAFNPIIFPSTSTNGPPEYPGFRRASVITILSAIGPHCDPPSELLSLVIIPSVMLGYTP